MSVFLLEDDTPTEDSYKWQSKLKYKWDTGAEKLTVSVSGGQLEYGFEYVARTHGLIITPLTEKCYFSIIQAVHARSGVACVSERSATGKETTIRQLACALGRSPYTLNCDQHTEQFMVASWLTGRGAHGLRLGCCGDRSLDQVGILYRNYTQILI